jgi:hypothetical protein
MRVFMWKFWFKPKPKKPAEAGFFGLYFDYPKGESLTTNYNLFGFRSLNTYNKLHCE